MTPKQSSTTSTTSARVAGVASRTRAASDAIKRDLEGLRGSVCVGPRHPGRPEDYRVAVRATCFPATPEGRAAAAAAAKRRKEKAAAAASTAPGVAVAQTRAEVKRLEEEMASVYPDSRSLYDKQFVSGEIRTLSFDVLKFMLDPRERRLVPDPLVRYNRLVKALFRRSNFPGQGAFPVGDLSRHMILQATLEGLRSNLPPSAAPRSSLLGRPSSLLGSQQRRQKIDEEEDPMKRITGTSWRVSGTHRSRRDAPRASAAHG